MLWPRAECLALCCLALLLWCRWPVAAGEIEQKGLALAAELGIPSQAVAFMVVDPEGQVSAHRATQPMVPASNLKLVTAAAALEILGPEFGIRTDLRRVGPIQEGVLEGDLFVVGRGDPGISGRFFAGDPVAELRAWCGVLRELGVRQVRGQLLADDTYLAGPTRLPGWPQSQLHRWYCAPSGALNLNDNCVDVHLIPRPEKSTIEVQLKPQGSLFRLRSQLTPVYEKSSHLYRVERKPGSWEIQVAGKFLISGGERVEWITVPDPTLAFLDAFQSLLASEGISIAGGVGRAPAPQSAQLITRCERPVAALIPVFLKKSQNLYGDCLLRILGRVRGGDGSFTSGSRQLSLFLEAVTGITDGFVIQDGSGLSSQNRLTAEQLVKLLRYAARRPWFPIFRDSLAVAGWDGTLARRFQGSPLKGRLHAKTGTLEGASNLAGWLRTDRGGVTFALTFNGAPHRTDHARRWQQQFLEFLLERYGSDTQGGQ
ncbi:MAG: D-alanyl-D-alanine carboxypeptidase/D-alanyl-D-alanine-endopeptidase [Planctomycetota bacterium]